MEMRPYGKTGYQISALGYGCASYWGMPYYSEREATELVYAAIDNGINFFDTGHSYSMGNAEPRLGRILKSLPISKRNTLLISTKAGTRNGNYGKLYQDYSPKMIVQSVEQSLTQLNLECLPILHLHGPSSRHLTEELFFALNNLKKQGKVKVLGINSFYDPVIESTVNFPEIESVMIDYNILKQDRQPQIERLHLAGKAIIGGGALANHAYVHPIKKIKGLRDIWYFLRSMKHHRLAIEKAKKYHWMHKQPDLSANQIALSFALSNPLICCSVFGTTRMKHLLENITSSNIKLSPEMMKKISENEITVSMQN